MQRRVVVAVLSACLLCVLCPVHARFYYKDFRDLSHLRLAGAARQSPRPSSSRPALSTGARQQCVAITWAAQPDAQAQTQTGSDTNAAGAIAPTSPAAAAAVAAPSAPSSVQTGALWYDREISMERENTAKPKQGPDGFVTSFHFRITPTMQPLNLTSRRAALAAHAAETAAANAADHMHPADEAAAAAAALDAALLADDLTDSMPPGGDGFAFVIRSASSGPLALGDAGSGMGYSGLAGPGIAVEFDTRMDLAERDPNANHVSVHVQSKDGAPIGSYESDDSRITSIKFAQLSLRRPRILLSTLASAAPAVKGKTSLTTNKALTAQISYQPQLRALQVFVEDLVSPVLIVHDVPPLDGRFLIGFTSSTGHGTHMDTHEICQWYFEKQRTIKTAARSEDDEHEHSEHANASPVAMIKQKLAADPKPQTMEGCDEGFTGDSCTLDLRALAQECLFATHSGCGGCLSHPSGHCQWCASQKRCISSEIATRTFDQHAHKPYCSDPASIVEDKDECSEAPSYVMWGSSVVLLVIVVCTIIALTGNLWIRSKNNATLMQDATTLIFYTIMGSLFSIVMTSMINMVLTEITTSGDASAGLALGVFLALFAALLWRDMQHIKAAGLDGAATTAADAASSGRWRAGGLPGGVSPLSVNGSSISYAQILNPDDNIASSAILSSFEKQQHRNQVATPVAGAASPVTATLLPSTYARKASRKLVLSLTSMQGLLFVPSFFLVEICVAILLCLLLLTQTDWSNLWAGTLWKRAVYCTLSIALCFTLAYLLLSGWRLGKILLSAAWESLCGRHGPLNCCFGRSGWSARDSGGVKIKTGEEDEGDQRRRIGMMVHPRGSLNDGGSSADDLSLSHRPDLGERLSAFASTSLLRSAAQIRIMGVSALISGVYFGCMFGGLDREDTTKSHLDLVVQRENYYSYPLAAFLGAMGAFTNQYLDLYRATRMEAVVFPPAAAASAPEQL